MLVWTEKRVERSCIRTIPFTVIDTWTAWVLAAHTKPVFFHVVVVSHCFSWLQVCFHKLQAWYDQPQLVQSGSCLWNICFPMGLGECIISYVHLGAVLEVVSLWVDPNWGFGSEKADQVVQSGLSAFTLTWVVFRVQHLFALALRSLMLCECNLYQYHVTQFVEENVLVSRLVSECVTLVFVSEFKLAHLMKKTKRNGFLRVRF